LKFDAVFLEVADARDWINRKYIHRNMFECSVLEHRIGEHVATDTATAPADQIDSRRNNAVLAESLDDLFLQLLLRDTPIAIVILAPEPGAFHFHIFNRNACGFQTVIF